MTLCSHDVAEMDVAAVADGMCPLCLAAENERLTHEIESYRFGLAYISLNPGCDAQTIAKQTLEANEQSAITGDANE